MATPPPGARRPTLADVATTAGVSPATASRALGGMPGIVRQDLAARVRDTAARLGYVRHRRRTPRPPNPVGYAIVRAGAGTYRTIRAAQIAAGHRNAQLEPGDTAGWQVYALVPVHTGYREASC